MDQDAVAARLRAAGCVRAEDEAALLLSHTTRPSEIAALVERRARGEPLEHLLGWAQFCGLRLAVDPGVFVPRHRSEFLVELACAAGPRARVVVDLCCGSGALGLAVAARIPGADLHAADVDPAAVACARRNLAAAGGTAYTGDLDAPLPARLRGKVDLLVANVPYVPTSGLDLMPAEARLHEPRRALDGGPDGLDLVRRVAGAAPRWLAPGGAVLVETSRSQAPAAAAEFVGAGLSASVHYSDEFDATVVRAFRIVRDLGAL